MAVRRFGEMIKVKDLEAYAKWHANPMPGVNEMIKECHLKNYSIYSLGDYLFSYYEYDGDDFEADMAKNGSRSQHPGMVGCGKTVDAAAGRP